MCPSVVDPAFIAVGGTLLGAILGAYITYYFALRITEKNARMVSGTKLRAAFTPEIAECGLLDPATIQGGRNFGKIIRNALPRHAAAIEEYRWFVPPERQRAYQQAWENYCRPGWVEGNIEFSEYLGDDGGRVFKQRISAILKFTED